MKLIEIETDKKRFLPLLLLADEQESMIDRYIDRGAMWALDDGGIKAVCIVTDEGDGRLEIKNIAVEPQYQRMGYGRAMIAAILGQYADTHTVVSVGTGDSPLTVPFYEACGFRRSHIVKNFFVDHYDHPIVEAGKQLTDMIYFKREM
ncbi:MAG: GNAT family N-acetyltransferase [Eubacteriales bacterium]|nr:GNAT family N-acetyltransferase [Eubacteriales bacterium]